MTPRFVSCITRWISNSGGRPGCGQGCEFSWDILTEITDFQEIPSKKFRREVWAGERKLQNACI